MTDRILEDWIDSYLTYTDNSEPPVMFRLWSAISVIAACLQRKCKLVWGDLTFFPNLYIVLVGPPAARKGTAMNQAYPFLENLNIKMAAEAITREALIQELCKANDNDIDVKTGKMLFHSSLTIWSQELTVFLGYNNLQLMSDLTDWYDCKNKWTYRTKHMGTDEILGVYVNLFGATTPTLIRSTMPLDAIGSGLTSRMIFVFERDKEKVVPYTGKTKEEKKIGKSLETDLERIRMMSGNFKGTEAFMDKWISWYSTQAEDHHFNDIKFEGYIQRRGNHVMKLSMVMSAARSSDMILDEIDIHKSIDILERTEKKMLHTFSGVGRSSHADVLARVMLDVTNAGEEGLWYSDLVTKYRDDADDWVMDKIIKTLHAMNFIRKKETPEDLHVTYIPESHRRKNKEEKI